MHIGRLFPVALAAQADGSPREEDGRDQSPAHTQPSEYKGPVIGNVSVVPQRLEAANKRTWHHVLNALVQLGLALRAQAARGSEQQHRGGKREADAQPRQHQRPVVADPCALLQNLTVVIPTNRLTLLFSFLWFINIKNIKKKNGNKCSIFA